MRLKDFAIVLLLATTLGCQESRTVYELLAEASHRPARGRLAAIDTYRPHRDARSRLNELTPSDLRAWTGLDRATAFELEASTPARRLLEGAYIDLFFAQYARAALRLEELRVTEGDSAHRLNDLAVVMLEWALVEGQPLDLLEALRLSSRAVASQPECSPCRFNYALILSQLHLRHRAIEEWKRFIQLAPASPWTAEAEDWIARLSLDRYEEKLEEFRDQFLSREAIGEEQLQPWVESMPEEVRTLVEEEILGRWARAFKADDTEMARFWQERATMASRLLERRGSWLLADALSRLHEAPTAELSKAHELFSRAMSAYHGQDFEQAEALLAAAEHSFSTSGSIYADVAVLYRAICVYYRDVDAARKPLEPLLARSSAERHPSLVARTLWMLGILDMVQRRTDLALRRYTRMRPLLETSMGPDRAAVADTMMAETLELRGEVERGWEHRLQGLSRIVFRTDPRRRHSALLEAAQALARRGDAELALIFFDELVENTSRWQQPLSEAEAFSGRARARFLRDDLDGANRDLELAFAALNRMPHGDPLRERTTHLTRFYLGMVRAREQPRAGLQLMKQAHDALEAGGWREEHLEHLKQRAQTFLELGDLESMRKILLASVQEIEQLRSQTEDTMSRLEILRHAQGFHEALIRLTLEQGEAESFDQAERARGRELFELDDQLSVAALVREHLPQDESLVLFTSLPEDLWVWVVTRNRFDRLRLGIERSVLEQQIELFLDALRVGDSAASRRAGEWLHTALIEPLSLDLNKDGRLVVVPDLMLSKLPFAALLDAERQTFLIEETALAQAPSVSLYLKALRHRSPQLPDTALVVADPDLGGTNFASLQPLQNALQEAEVVAGFYPRSKLILGREATADQLMANLSRYTIFHFAGHAFASGPALDDSLLLLSQDATGNAQLAASEVRRLELSNLRVAVLSACHSADGVRQGREAAASLAAAFLGAGVSTVVAARWAVTDRDSLQLMADLHKHLSQGMDAASAYRQVVLDLLSSDQPEQRNPGYWSVFVVLGA